MADTAELCYEHWYAIPPDVALTIDPTRRGVLAPYRKDCALPRFHDGDHRSAEGDEFDGRLR